VVAEVQKLVWLEELVDWRSWSGSSGSFVRVVGTVSVVNVVLVIPVSSCCKDKGKKE